MRAFSRIKHKIELMVNESSVPEDPVHSKNTLKWLISLDSKACEAMRIAALGHDIERANHSRKVNLNDFSDYDSFKNAHCNNSAKILTELMIDCNYSKPIIKEVDYLVKHHEFGGNEKANLLIYADSLSFFKVNLPLYFKRNSLSQTKKRFLWGYNRLSTDLRSVIKTFKYQEKHVQSMVYEWLKELETKKQHGL